MYFLFSIWVDQSSSIYASCLVCSLCGWPIVPRGGSWTPSWRRLRSGTRSSPSCWPTRSPSWWRRASPARPWPRPWPGPRTPCRTSPGPARGSGRSSPAPPPTRLARTLQRLGDGREARDKTSGRKGTQSKTLPFSRALRSLSAALKYSGLTEAYRTPFPSRSLLLMKTKNTDKC